MRTSYEAFENDIHKKIYVSLKKNCCKYNNQCAYLPNISTRCLGIDFFNKFNKLFPNVSIYGFSGDIEQKKIKENIPDIQHLRDFVSDYFAERGFSWRELDTLNQNDNRCVNGNQELMKCKDKINNLNSVMFKFIDNVEKFKKLQEKYVSVMFLTSVVEIDEKNRDFNLTEDFAKVGKEYPLLSSLARIDKDNLQSIINYINLIDAKNGV